MNYPAHFRRAIVNGVEHLLRLAQEVRPLSDSEREQALHQLDFALKLDEAWPVARDLLLTMAEPMEQAGYRDEWMGYLESGLAQSLALRDVDLEAELRFQLGILYKDLARFDDAQSQFELSAKHFENVGNVTLLARSLNRLADVARQQCHFEKATQLAQTALALSTAERAYSYLVLGLTVYDQRDWQSANQFFKKSLDLWQDVSNRRMIAWSLNNLGMSLWKLKKDKEAIICYEKAINLFEMVQDPVHQAAARMNLGIIYFAQGRLSKAIELYLLAEPVFRRTQNQVYLAMVNNNKGMAYQKLQRWDNAKLAYRFSIRQWQEIGNINALVNVMDNLGLAYLEQDQHEKALETFEEALYQLKKIRNKAGYDHLFDMVSKNFGRAMELLTSK